MENGIDQYGGYFWKHQFPGLWYMDLIRMGKDNRPFCDKYSGQTDFILTSHCSIYANAATYKALLVKTQHFKLALDDS